MEERSTNEGGLGEQPLDQDASWGQGPDAVHPESPSGLDAGPIGASGGSPSGDEAELGEDVERRGDEQR